MALADIILREQSKGLLESEPLNIIEFAQSKSGLGLRLYPAQRFILKLFYGLPLLDEVELHDPIIIRDKYNEKELHRFSEREFIDFLYAENRININYEQYVQRDRPYNEAIFAIGRRGSKTVMSSIISLYTLYLLLRMEDPHEYFRVLPADRIGIAIASNTGLGATRQYESITSMINSSPFFKSFVVSDNSGQMILETRKAQELRKQGKYSEGYQVSISAFAVSPAVRGASNVVVILDEFAHFMDSDVSQKDKPLDEVMYEGLTPSISGFTTPDGRSFGKKFIISSPNGLKGMMYKMVQEARKYNENTLTINTPSHWVNLRVSSDEIKDLYSKSELSARQEFGGEFVTKESDWISNPNKVWACVNALMPNDLPAFRSPTSMKYFLGIDLGLSWDGASFAVAHIEDIRPEQEFIKPGLESLVSKDSRTFVVDYIKYLSPHNKDNGVLDMDEVIETLKLIMSRFNIVKGIYDQWAGELWTQLFAKHGIANKLEQFNATQQSNNDVAMNFKQLIMEGQLMLPDYPEFIDEVFSLKETVGRNGLIKVENTSEHDDRFVSVAKALYLCYINQDKTATVLGSSSRVGIIGSTRRNVYNAGVSGLNKGGRMSNAAYNKRVKAYGLR